MRNEQLIQMETLKKAAEDVKNKWPDLQAELAIILGSGWGDVVNTFKKIDELPYGKITGFKKSSVTGHANKLVRAQLGGKDILIFQGRQHWYEVQEWTPVILPSYIAKKCGAKSLLTTNASGGISFNAGSLMIVKDHINLLMSNPLLGPHHEELGPRFPDQSEVYSEEITKKIKKVGKDLDIHLNEGVYCATSGPMYETPAEIRMYKTLGADAIGMSTVPEIMVANSMGLNIGAISCIANKAAGLNENPLSHEEVIQTMKSIMPKMEKILPKIVGNILF